MNGTQKTTATLAVTLCLATVSQAQWISFNNQTGTRLPTGGGQNNPATTTADPEEKDYTWGDVDHDGDLDLVIMRKRPLSCEGGKPDVLLMNEGGILMDRTSTKANTAIGVPGGQGVSQGFLDNTNDRQAVLVDVNNDGWLDIVTCTTMSDNLPQYISHPRVYMNMGESGGVWQGFRYEYARFPNLGGNPRFCGVAAGDLTGDGYVDLFFVDYDTPESAYCPLIFETCCDTNNKLVINQGAANPGYFSDEGGARMPGQLGATFGAHTVIVDANFDGKKDIVRINTLNGSLDITIFNNINLGTGFGSALVYNGAPYSVASGELNNDGRYDLVISDDSNDRYSLNTTGSAGANPTFAHSGLTSAISTDSAFSGANIIVDIDNDGWNDAIVADQDLDTNYSAARRTRIYRNQGAAAPAGQQLRELSPAVLPTDATGAKSVYNMAVFDIDGDGWKDILLGRGGMTSGDHNNGSTQVWMSNGKPGLTFSFPGGQPAYLVPDSPTVFNVQLNPDHGGVAQNNPTIAYSINGAGYSVNNLVSLGGNLWQATIPAQPCGTSVRYYITGQVTTGATFTSPNGAPGKHHNVAASNTTSTMLSENFEGAAAGWTVENDGGLTGGAWELGDPNPTWFEGLKASPPDDTTPAGTKAYVTGLGAPGGLVGTHDVDDGATHLVSPTIDLSGGNAQISFQRWFYSNYPEDVLQVSVSNDNGTNWTTVTNVPGGPIYNWNAYSSEYTQTTWAAMSFHVGDYVTPTAQVKVRFTVNDVTPASFVEAGVDDFVVTQIPCDVTPCNADINGDNNVNITDLLAVVAAWGMTGHLPEDVSGDGTVNITDLLLVIGTWGACP